jgi:hypothetical protein
MMRRLTQLICIMLLALAAKTTIAAPCLIVTLTGTQGGPSVYNGLAGSGTLVRYGDDSNHCNAVRLQFDAGRGTSMRLSQLELTPAQLHAVSSPTCTQTMSTALPISSKCAGTSIPAATNSMSCAAQMRKPPPHM